MFNEKDLITVRDDVFRTLAATAIRYALLAAASGVIGIASVRLGQVVLLPGLAEGLAAGAVALGTMAYGLVKTWRVKRDSIALATSAPNGAVIRDGQRIA